MTSFNVDVDQNEFLPIDGSEVNAVITVKSTPDGAPTLGLDAAEIVIVDTSGSMAVPRSKMKAAREATSVAIDCIRDGVAFGVIAGTEKAKLVYPKTQTLVPASPAARAEAKQAVARLEADGGTAIGTWLRLTRSLFGAPKSGRNCHAILLTDGANEHETPEELHDTLSACQGYFQCDCRGVGTDWVVSELKGIASTLLGEAEIIHDPADMAADFRSTMEAAMAKTTGSVSLRLWTPQGAEVAFVRQVFPTIEELTERGVQVDARTAEYPTGTWGQESRDYHVCIKVQPRDVGEKMLAARVNFAGDEELGEGKVIASWTGDERLSTRINGKVAHYTGQEELADCIQDGLKARDAGDQATAQVKLGRAVQLASQSGNDGTLKLLRGVVDVADAATGTVRLRREVADVDEMTLDTRSTKTIRARPPS